MAAFSNKRPRLSPHLTASHGLTGHTTHLSPNSPVLLANGTPTMPAPGNMGPPTRPLTEKGTEKATDTAELADVVAQSGINIRDEEQYLTAQLSQDRRFSASGPPHHYPAIAATSSTPAYLPNGAYKNYLSHFAGQAQQNFTPGVSPTHSALPKSAVDLAHDECRAQARQQAQRNAHPFNDPFLNLYPVRLLLDRHSSEAKIRPAADGIIQRHHPTPGYGNVGRQSHSTSAGTSTGTEVRKGSPLAEILNLLTLGTKERIRVLLEDAAAVMQARRAWSNGAVEGQWADLAISRGKEAATAIATAGRAGADKAAGPNGNPRKRSYSTANLPTPVSSASQTPAVALTFPNELAKNMRALGNRDRAEEEARLAKRSKKQGSMQSSADGAKGGSTAPGTPGSAPAKGGLLGERAPEAGTKRMSKKEQAKNARMIEANQHRSANSTASMMIGRGGASRFGKTSYAWMNVASTPTGSTARPNAASTPGTPGPPTPSHQAAPLTFPTGRRFGEWREDSEKGAGIQLRDLINSLEANTKGEQIRMCALEMLK